MTSTMKNRNKKHNEEQEQEDTRAVNEEQEQDDIQVMNKEEQNKTTYKQ